jgi:hypothetical protein
LKEKEKVVGVSFPFQRRKCDQLDRASALMMIQLIDRIFSSFWKGNKRMLFRINLAFLPLNL